MSNHKFQAEPKTRSNSNSHSSSNIESYLNIPNERIEQNNDNINYNNPTNVLTPPHDAPNNPSLAAVQKIIFESTTKPKIDFSNPPKILKRTKKDHKDSLNTLMSAIKKLENANNSNAFKASRKNLSLKTINRLINEQINKIEQSVLNNNNFEENINLHTLNELTINLQNTVHERIMGLKSKHWNLCNAPILNVPNGNSTNRLPRLNVPVTFPQTQNQLNSHFVHDQNTNNNYIHTSTHNHNNYRTDPNNNNNDLPRIVVEADITNSTLFRQNDIVNNNSNTFPTYDNSNNTLINDNTRKLQTRNSNYDINDNHIYGSQVSSSVDTVLNESPKSSSINFPSESVMVTPKKQIVYSPATYYSSNSNNEKKDQRSSQSLNKLTNKIKFDVPTSDKNFTSFSTPPNFNNQIRKTPNLQLIGNSYTLFPQDDENNNTGKNMIVIPTIADNDLELESRNKLPIRRGSSVSSISADENVSVNAGVEREKEKSNAAVTLDDDMLDDDGEIKKCFHCQSSNTPEWRTGPYGKKNICNACGLFYRKLLMKFGIEGAGLLMNYRRSTCSTNRKVPAFIQIPKDFFEQKL